jgi:hypothetical protein
MAWPATPLPNPKYPKADSRLFDLSPFGLRSPFMEKVGEILARITDEAKAREWLHDNGISGIQFTTPFWSIDTRDKNFWTGVADALTPIVVKAGSAVPIVGQLFAKAYSESQAAPTKLSVEEYQSESLYQSIMNGKAAVPGQGGNVAGKVETSTGFDWSGILAVGLFFFSFCRAKGKSVKLCYLRLSQILIFPLRTFLTRTFQKLLSYPKWITPLLKSFLQIQRSPLQSWNPHPMLQV